MKVETSLGMSSVSPEPSEAAGVRNTYNTITKEHVWSTEMYLINTSINKVVPCLTARPTIGSIFGR